jgi:general secretion pathway protein E
MQDMGIERYLITSTVNGVLSQRLVRRLCPHCKKAALPKPELLQSYGLARFARPDAPVYEARGCEHCRGTGYQGRTGIHELLVVDEAMRSAILQGHDASALQQLATRSGMLTLYEDGLRKVAAGVTSLDEVLRVTQDELQEAPGHA